MEQVQTLATSPMAQLLKVEHCHYCSKNYMCSRCSLDIAIKVLCIKRRWQSGDVSVCTKWLPQLGQVQVQLESGVTGDLKDECTPLLYTSQAGLFACYVTAEEQECCVKFQVSGN